ncbi:hypothetical protein NNJEOMEG_03965 [Fundidesulfovibrio magnetotacticus]|uniref:NADPH-dependent FMN reductase-like domain-containing protein n=1 Tax=Fundidesulfovibrio magnetotacticus TaxID=2730080 RepID=A0A6V8LZX9_9BACT|nr:NAD(P)H-dependent oxidoreductase [Fundidesulfovibrio magnetotacticus]GFK96091.1 hypothetical protein NNJEOMEG_03965 [Fundidesulfovibrio magnetotacticus]
MKAVLLVGSPKRAGASAVLGEALLERLQARGVETETLRLTGLLDAQEGRARLHGAFLGADLCVLAAPVYADSLPAPAVRALEFLDDDGPAPERPRAFAALVNCGFPEASHTQTCLDACRVFARRTGLRWAGGLGVGQGGVLGEGPLEARGAITASLRKALDLSAHALAAGEDIPEGAVRLAAKPLMPRLLYLAVAELGWLAQAWSRRTFFRLGAKPLQRP